MPHAGYPRRLQEAVRGVDIGVLMMCPVRARGDWANFFLLRASDCERPNSNASPEKKAGHAPMVSAGDVVRSAINKLLTRLAEVVRALHTHRQTVTSNAGPLLRATHRHLLDVLSWHDRLVGGQQPMLASIALARLEAFWQNMREISTRVNEQTLATAVEAIRCVKVYVESVDYEGVDVDDLRSACDRHPGMLGMILSGSNLNVRCEILRRMNHADIVIDLLLLPEVYAYERRHIAPLVGLAGARVQTSARHKSIYFTRG